MTGQLRTLFCRRLGLVAMLKQILSHSIGTCIGQRVLVDVQRASHIDGEVATRALRILDIPLVVGGSNESRTTCATLTESGIRVALVARGGCGDELIRIALGIRAEGELIEEHEDELGERDDEILIHAL